MGACPSPGCPRRRGQLLSYRGGSRRPPGRRGCCRASPRRKAPSGMGRAKEGKSGAGGGKEREVSQGPGVRGQRGIGAGTRGLLSGEGGSAPCRCPPPWPRHSGGCRRRGPPQGPSPKASSRAEGGAARSSGGGCRCRCRRRRTHAPPPPPNGKGGSGECADGGLSGRHRLLRLPPLRQCLPSDPQPSQPRLRLPRPPRHPTPFIDRIAQAPALGYFRRRPKSASPRLTRRERKAGSLRRRLLRSPPCPTDLSSGSRRRPSAHGWA